MRVDVADLKLVVNHAADNYATKEQLLNTRIGIEERIRSTEKRVSSIYTYGSIVLAIVTATLLGVFFRIVLKF